jgi:hypothetical protein
MTQGAAGFELQLALSPVGVARTQAGYSQGDTGLVQSFDHAELVRRGHPAKAFQLNGVERFVHGEPKYCMANRQLQL